MSEQAAINVEDLKRRLDDGEDLFLLDVREPDEVQDMPMKGQNVTHIPMGSVPDKVEDLPDDQPIVVFCAKGGRSAKVQEYLLQTGHTNVINLIGGMTPWADSIDPSLKKA